MIAEAQLITLLITFTIPPSPVILELAEVIALPTPVPVPSRGAAFTVVLIKTNPVNAKRTDTDFYRQEEL
jgi:hypothetical protein